MGVGVSYERGTPGGRAGSVGISPLNQIKIAGRAISFEARADFDGLPKEMDQVYRGTSLIRNCPPARTFVGP